MFKIGQLIIIGGPPCAGKTFLIKKIRQGDYPRLCEQLGMANPVSWRYVPYGKLAGIREPTIERLVVPYDFYANYSHRNGFGILSELMTNTDSVTVLTLYIPPKVLIQRLNSRILVTLKSLFYIREYRGKNHPLYVLRRFRKIQRRRKAYKRGYSEFLYERWFNYINQFSVINHWVLNNNKLNTMIAHPYKPDEIEIYAGIKEGMNS